MFFLPDIRSYLHKPILLFGILLLSFLIGLPNGSGISTYALGELYRDLDVVREIDSGHLLLLGANSSLGSFHFGPAYYYLIYPFVKIGNFALSTLAFSSLFFSLATITLCFFVVKSWWRSDLLAYLVTSLMAFSIFTFQLVQYGSNPNLVPFFGLLFFYALKQFLDEGQRFYSTLLLGLSFGIATQLHAVPFVSLPVILLVFAVKYFRRLNWKLIAIFLFVTALTYIPYLYSEFTSGFVNTKALFEISTSQNNYAPLSYRLVDFMSFLLLPVLSLNSYFNVVTELSSMTFLIFAIALFFFAVIFFYNLRNRKFFSLPNLSFSKDLKNVLLLWGLIPSAVLLVPIGGIIALHYYYFLILYPLLFILLGIGLYKMLQNGLHLAVGYMGIGFLGLQFYQIYLYHQLISNISVS